MSHSTRKLQAGSDSTTSSCSSTSDEHRSVPTNSLHIPNATSSKSVRPPALLMLNIQGLDPSASSSLSWKVPYLDVLVNSSLQHYSVISITETHVKDQINDAQMNITGYNAMYTVQIVQVVKKREVVAFTFKNHSMYQTTPSMMMIIVK